MCGRLAIFDLDGTLVDSSRDLATAGNAARQAVALPDLPLATIVTYIGDGVNQLIERLTPEVTSEQRAAAAAAFHAVYARVLCDQTRPYDGIPQLVRSLVASGWTLGVATNKRLDYTERILAGCGLRDCFAAVRGGDVTRKPDPTALREIMQATHRPEPSGWMIGDHHTDIQAGHAAGLRVAFCSWGLGHRQDLAVEGVAARPSQLATLLGTGRA